MSMSNYDSLLTPAARQMLSELLRDLHEQILRDAAVEAMRATGDLREITVSDIARSYARLQGGRAGRRNTFADRVLRAYESIAFLMGVAGLGAYLVARYFGIEALQGREDLLIGVGASGIALFLASGLMRRFRSLNGALRILQSPGVERLPESDPIANFVARWVELEIELRSVAAQTLGESASGMPVSRLLMVLTEVGVLSSSDTSALKNLLSMRNSVVHGRVEIPPEEIRNAMREMREVLDRLPRTGGPR